MSKKQTFIDEVTKLIEKNPLSDEAMDYFNGLQATADPEKAPFTVNGKIVLGFMQKNKDAYNNLFKAKDIGEALGIASRTISGGFRKLVNDGYVEKVGEGSPIVYSMTQKGIDANLDAE